MIINPTKRVCIPNFPMEQAFHLRQLRNSISDKMARLELMRAAAGEEKNSLVSIEHVEVDGEELVLISRDGSSDGVAVAAADIESGAIRLQDVVSMIATDGQAN